MLQLKLRYVVMLAGTVMVLAMTAPALAAKKKPPKQSDWNACYDLGWVRGVHTEQGELEDWMDQCLHGEVAGSPVTKATRRQPRDLRNLNILG